MEMPDEKQTNLYPNLEPLQPSAPLTSSFASAAPLTSFVEPRLTNSYINIDETKAQSFRLHKINEIQKLLESERDRRESLAKKYQRGINILSGVSYANEIAAVGLGVAGVSLLSTVIATPIVIVMEAVALGAGGLSVVGNLICDSLFFKS